MGVTRPGVGPCGVLFLTVAFVYNVVRVGQFLRERRVRPVPGAESGGTHFPGLACVLGVSPGLSQPYRLLLSWKASVEDAGHGALLEDVRRSPRGHQNRGVLLLPGASAPSPQATWWSEAGSQLTALRPAGAGAGGEPT